MGVHATEHTAVIAAPAERCFDAMSDFESYPEWQSQVKRCTVLERARDAVLVETVTDIMVREIRYVLRYRFDRPHRLWWEYVEGDARDVEGDFSLQDLGDGTAEATYRIAVDPGRFVPGAVGRLVAREGTRRAVEDLRARVEPS
jgi:ribosome-associated toxin RatA of RatAB toxin-antitoxin module